MKNVSLGVNVLLLVAVIVLYVLYFSGKEITRDQVAGIQATTGQETRIVYLNIDSLLINYTQSREMNEAYLKKLEESRTDLNLKVKTGTRTVEDFQRKVDNNGFLTRERANQEYTNLMLEKEKLEKQEQEMHETARREQDELNQKLFNIITTFLTEYNKDKGYNMILSTTMGGNVFYAEPEFDITREVVSLLNARYTAKP